MLVGASGGIYVWIFSMYYMFAAIKINDFFGAIQYTLYMSVFALFFSIMGASMSTIASYFFLDNIYKRIRAD